MSSEFKGGTFIGTKDSGFFAEIDYEPVDGGGLVAHAYVNAPGRGDEILAAVNDAIQTEANTIGQPITHRAVAENRASTRLFRRSGEYTIGGRSSTGHNIFTREFTPSDK